MDDVSYLVESGIIANDKPLQALKNKMHFWVIKGVWHSPDPQNVITQGAIVLNDENVVRIDGPSCLFCDVAYDREAIFMLSECPGVQP